MQLKSYFIQINAEQLGELITANVKKALVPLFHQLHSTTPNPERYTQKLSTVSLREVFTAIAANTRRRKPLYEPDGYQAARLEEVLQKLKIGMEG